MTQEPNNLLPYCSSSIPLILDYFVFRTWYKIKPRYYNNILQSVVYMQCILLLVLWSRFNLVVLHHVHHDIVCPLRVRVFYPLRPVVAQSIPFRRGGVDYVRRSTMGVMRHHAACVMAGEERGREERRGDGRRGEERGGEGRGGKGREGISVNEETREDEHIGAVYVTPRVKNTPHSKVKRTGRNCRA